MLAFLVVALGAVGRIKYIWQGNKIRRRRSARDVSRKFLIVSWIIYVIMLAYNWQRRDVPDIIFWFVGIFTVGYAIVMCYRYRADKADGLMAWFIQSFRVKEEDDNC